MHFRNGSVIVLVNDDGDQLAIIATNAAVKHLDQLIYHPNTRWGLFYPSERIPFFIQILGPSDLSTGEVSEHHQWLRSPTNGASTTE